MFTSTLTRSLLCLTTVAFASLGHARSVAAQELGQDGNLTLAVERLFGFAVGSETVDAGPVEVDTDYTTLALGWNAPATPLTAPRLGLDYFIDESLTVGGSFGVFSRNMDTVAGDADVTGILFAARIGYALRLTDAISFWPRGGISYYTFSSDTVAFERNLLALSLEGVFVFSPAPHWAFTVSPVFDLGFSGEDANRDLTEQNFGVLLGMLGYFGG